MSDAEKQLDELARITEQLNREMMVYGQISKQTSDQMLDAQVQSATGIKNFSKGMAAGGDAISALAGSAMAAGKAMYEGKKGAGAFNESLDGMAKAAAAAGLMLTLMIPGGPIIKLLIAGVTAAVGAMVAYTKAANDMADKLYKGFSGLTKSGAVASEGMTGVFKGAKKLGLSMNELDGYVGQVAASSQDLALFAGTAFEGRQKLEDMGQALEGNRQQFLSMGMSMSDVSEGMLGYLKLQTRIGNAQNMTTAQLAAGAKGYLIEMDGLSKMTGLSRKAMEDQIESARSEQRFRAKLEEVRATQGEAAAKRMETANVMLSAQSKEAGQGFRDMATGMLGTEAAMKYNMSTQGAGMEATQDLIDGKITEVEMIKKVGTAMGEFAKDMNMAAQTGTLSGFSIEYSDMLKLGILAQKDLVGIQAKVTEEQNKQGLAGKEAADKLLAKQAELIDKQIAVNKKMETAVFDGIPNAQANMIRLVGATDSVADGFTKLSKAINWLLKLVGLGEKTDKGAEKQTEIDANAAKKATAEKASATANAGNDPAAKEQAAQDLKFYTERETALAAQKKNIAQEDANFAANKARIERAKQEDENARAKYDALMETADWYQKLGINQTEAQSKAYAEWQKASGKHAQESWRSVDAPPVADPQKAPVAPAPGTAPPVTDPQKAPVVPAPGTPVERRAAGGPVDAKTPYLIGEDGPELFMPTAGGDILSNPAMKSQMSGIQSMLSTLGGTVNQKSGLEDSIGKTSENIFDSMKKLLGFTNADATQAETSSLAFKQSLDLKSAAEDSIGKTSEEIDAGMKKLLGFTNANTDTAEKSNLSGNLYALNMQASLGNILEDSKKLEKLTDVDVKRAEKYSLAYKSYMDIKTDLITLETPDIKEQIKILQDKALEASGGGGAWGGESRKGSSSSSMGGAQGLSGGSASGMPSMGGGQGVTAPVPPGAGEGPTSAGGGDSKPKLGTISSKSGKSTSVAADAAPAFQKLLDYLDSVDYPIQSLGGYVDRDVRGKPGVKSAHSKGGAIDINPAANPMGSTLVTDMPEGIKELASSLGLGWGGAWNSVKDAMHFSAAKNEGGRLMAEEGIQVDGPETGYPATLHGREAVIPMNNGAGDFVKMFKDIAESNRNMVDILETMVREQKNSTSIQEKILQTSQ